MSKTKLSCSILAMLVSGNLINGLAYASNLEEHSPTGKVNTAVTSVRDLAVNSQDPCDLIEYISGTLNVTEEEHSPTDKVNTTVTSVRDLAVNSQDPYNLIEYVSKEIEAATVQFHKLPGAYSVATFGLPISVKGDKGDVAYYFWLGHQFMLRTDDLKDRLFLGYAIKTTLENDSGTQLFAASPGTTEGSMTITSSISNTFGGNVGFFGDVPTGGFSGGVAISNSKSYNIPDIKVLNQSPATSTTSGALWLLEINPQSDAARNTIQPYFQALWKIPKTQRGKDDKFVRFTTNLTVIEGYMDWGFNPTPGMRHRESVDGVTYTLDFAPDPLK